MQATYLSILQFLKINVIYGWFELRVEKGEQKGVESIIGQKLDLFLANFTLPFLLSFNPNGLLV